MATLSFWICSPTYLPAATHPPHIREPAPVRTRLWPMLCIFGAASLGGRRRSAKNSDHKTPALQRTRALTEPVLDTSGRSIGPPSAAHQRPRAARAPLFRPGGNLRRSRIRTDSPVGEGGLAGRVVANQETRDPVPGRAHVLGTLQQLLRQFLRTRARGFSNGARPRTTCGMLA